MEKTARCHKRIGDTLGTTQKWYKSGGITLLTYREKEGDMEIKKATTDPDEIHQRICDFSEK